MIMEATFDAQAVEAQIGGLIGVLENPKSILESAGELIRADFKEQFAKGGIPPWQPLDEDTVKAKARAGYTRLTRKGEKAGALTQNGRFEPSAILLRTGAMMESLTNKEHPDHIEREASSLQGHDPVLVMGSTIPYFRYHQEGRGVPKRPLVITEGCLKQIAQAVEEQLMEAQRGNPTR